MGELDEGTLAERLDTDPDATLELFADLARATDEGLRARAHEIASEIFFEFARTHRVDGSGIGRMATTAYDPDASELDLDASMGALLAARAERRLVESDELRVRRWVDPSTAWCLVVDRSGSMNGQSLATAATAAAAVSLRADGELAVIAFAREAFAISAIWEHRPDIIERLLALTGTGTTDVAVALRAAHRQLEAAQASRRVTVLLSDCRTQDPYAAAASAAQLDELYILAPADDPDAAADLAERSGARWVSVEGPSDIARSIGALISR